MTRQAWTTTLLLFLLAGAACGSGPPDDEGSQGSSCYPNGTCDSGLDCVSGVCVPHDNRCVPECGERECGPEPACGQSCGTCGDGEGCQYGQCIPSSCQPDCAGRDCGPDPACGTACGTCKPGEGCIEGSCIADACDPDCLGRECGPDPVCQISCGSCEKDFWCDDGTCTDDCAGVECGTSPHVGADCGQCQHPFVCDTWKCVWTPDAYTVQCNGGMCRIPGGSFWMGCHAALDADCADDESPYHQVTLDPFWIDRTEVTVGAYAGCVSAGVCVEPDSTEKCNWPDRTELASHPVNCVTWAAADAYCRWAGKRLPTEAEWEMAARGTDGRLFPWGIEPATCEFAVMDEGGGIGCGTGQTMPSCSRSPAGDSPYGLCDMAGNVGEMAADWYDANYYVNSPSANPPGADDGWLKSTRNGGFWSVSKTLRCSFRSDVYHKDGVEGTRTFNLGFRCARDVP